MYDHFETVPTREPTHVFEAFTTLAALAQHTQTIRLGQLVTCAAYRNAGLLAKEAACVDVFSEGRLIFGLGAGWYDREYQAYGITYPSAGTRLRILEESLEVIKRLWTEETVTFQGKHLTFDGAYCDPKPIQRLPQIWVGGGGEKVTLRIAAQARDAHQLAGRSGRVRAQVAGAASSTATTSAATSTRSSARTVPTAGSSTARRTSTRGSTLRAAAPCGAGARRTSSTCATTSSARSSRWREKTQAFVDAGCQEFVLWFRDYPSSESVERFAKEVIPRIEA